MRRFEFVVWVVRGGAWILYDCEAFTWRAVLDGVCERPASLVVEHMLLVDFPSGDITWNPGKFVPLVGIGPEERVADVVTRQVCSERLSALESA